MTLVFRFYYMSSVRSTSDCRGPVTRKRVPDREEPGKPRKDARRGRCHPLEAGFWPLWMTQLPRTTITKYRIPNIATVAHGCHMQKTLFPGTYWVHARTCVLGLFLHTGCASAAWVLGGSLVNDMGAGRRCLATRVGDIRWSGSPCIGAGT